MNTIYASPLTAKGATPMKWIGPVLFLVLLSGCNDRHLRLFRSPENPGRTTGVLMGQSNIVSPSNSAQRYFSQSKKVFIKYRESGTEQWRGPENITEDNALDTSAMEILLGDKLATLFNEVYLYNHGHGNSTTRQWAQDHEGMLSAALAEIRRVKPDWIVWEQGDSDVFFELTEEESYNNLKEIFKRVHAASPNSAIYCARNSSSLTTNGSGIPILNAQSRVIREGYASPGIDFDSLRVAGYMADGISNELVGPGIEAHANLWFEFLKTRQFYTEHF